MPKTDTISISGFDIRAPGIQFNSFSLSGFLAIKKSPNNQEELDLIGDFCSKCWNGDFEGVIEIMQRPNVNQKMLINSSNTRYFLTLFLNFFDFLLLIYSLFFIGVKQLFIVLQGEAM